MAALHRSSIIAHCSSGYSAEQIKAWTAVLRPEAYSSLIDNDEVLVDPDEVDRSILGLGVCSPNVGVINAVYVAPGRDVESAGC